MSLTYLQLSQRLRQEAGLSGTGPTTVIGQTGDMKRVVDWIANAYNDIQNASMTWRFLRVSFNFPTVIGTNEYAPGDVGITDHATWITRNRDQSGAIRVYENVNDENRLQHFQWDDYREAYETGSNRSITGRPSIITVKPNQSLVIWPIPDRVYTIDGERYKAGAQLTANDDTPNWPSRFDLIAVWKGLIDYGAWAGADEKYAHGTNRYLELKRKLEIDQQEIMRYGRTLA